MDKKYAIQQLREEFIRWDDLLSDLEEKQTQEILYGNRRLKDEVAHLWEWQKMSKARLQAAIENKEPDFSYWPDWVDTLSEDDSHMDKINEWIYESNKDRSWKDIYTDWKETYHDVLHLAEEIDESKYKTKGIYGWLGNYTLLDVLIGSYNHYHEDHWPIVKNVKLNN